MYGLAALREAQERFQDAAALYQRALTIREQVYGLQHPKTIEAQERYAALLREMGPREEADALEEGPSGEV